MVCVGNSHLACVLAAAEAAGVVLDPIVFRDSRYFDEALSELVVVSVKRPFPKKAVRLLRNGGPVFSFIGGTRYLSLGLRANPVPYDFVLPTDDQLPVEEGVEIVPVNALRSLLTNGIRVFLERLKDVVEISRAPVYHFEPPPPPDERWFRSNQNGPAARYKLWRLHSEIVRDYAETVGVRFIRCPDEAVDHQRFGLRPEFARNVTHANAAYGALVLEQMKALA